MKDVRLVLDDGVTLRIEYLHFATFSYLQVFNNDIQHRVATCIYLPNFCTLYR